MNPPTRFRVLVKVDLMSDLDAVGTIEGWRCWLCDAPSPEREIHTVAIKGVRHDPDAVRQIPPDDDPALPRLARDGREVEELPAGEDHGGQHEDLHVVGQVRQDVFQPKATAVPRGNQAQRRRRILPTEAEMALQGIGVRGEVERVRQDHAPRGVRGVVEGREELMQVLRGLPAEREGRRRGAKQGREACRHPLRQVDPPVRATRPAVNGVPLPRFHRPLQRRLRATREQAERVAVEVDPALRAVKLGPQAREGFTLVPLVGNSRLFRRVRGLGGGGHETTFPDVAGRAKRKPRSGGSGATYGGAASGHLEEAAAGHLRRLRQAH